MTNAVRYYVTPPDSPDPDVQGGDVVEIELGVGGEKGVEADVIGESAGAGGGAGKQGGEGVGVGKEGEGGAGARAGKGEGGDGAKRTDSVEMVDSSVSKVRVSGMGRRDRLVCMGCGEGRGGCMCMCLYVYVFMCVCVYVCMCVCVHSCGCLHAEAS